MIDHIWVLGVTRLSQSPSGQRDYPGPSSRWEVLKHDKPKAGERAQHSRGLVSRPKRPKPDGPAEDRGVRWGQDISRKRRSLVAVKWVAATILAGAGIWGGVTWAIILRETKWRWIPVAIAAEAVIVAGAIVIPRLRPKMLLGAGAAVFVTAVTVALLIPSVWCSGSWTGGPGVCSDFPLWGGILVVGVGLVLGLTLVSFAREKPDRGGAGGDVA